MLLWYCGNIFILLYKHGAALKHPSRYANFLLYILYTVLYDAEGEKLSIGCSPQTLRNSTFTLKCSISQGAPQHQWQLYPSAINSVTLMVSFIKIRPNLLAPSTAAYRNASGEERNPPRTHTKMALHLQWQQFHIDIKSHFIESLHRVRLHVQNHREGATIVKLHSLHCRVVEPETPQVQYQEVWEAFQAGPHPRVLLFSAIITNHLRACVGVEIKDLAAASRGRRARDGGGRSSVIIFFDT